MCVCVYMRARALRIKPKTSHMLSKHSATELHSEPCGEDYASGRLHGTVVVYHSPYVLICFLLL